MEEAAEPRARGNDLQLERPRGRPHPAALHVVGEGRERQLLRDLRLADERARAAAADEVALADEVVEGGADGQPRDAEVGAELPLGRDRVADAELLDEVEDTVSRLALLRHVVKTTSSRAAGSCGGSPAASSVLPVFGSK